MKSGHNLDDLPVLRKQPTSHEMHRWCLKPPPPAGKEWKLIWNEEFDGSTLDETKWNRLGDWKRRDGFWVKDDAYLSGHGTLVLRTRKDGDRYTCGAVNTQGKSEHAFGYYVARCRMPKSPATGPPSG